MNPVPKILLVDDDPSLSKTLEAILKRKGYQTQTAVNGAEAIRMTREQTVDNLPNVALIDIRLPDINGLEVLKEIKKVQPDLVGIMMTGFANLQTSVEALNDGAYAYLLKPYNVDEVKALIEKALEKQRLVLENRALAQKMQEWNLELERSVQEKTAELQSQNLRLLEAVDKMKRMNDSMLRFVANASHELQTPMTSVYGFACMLIDYWEKIDKPQAIHFLEIIRDESQRLTRLIRDLLDLSHIQQGRMNLDFKRMDLRETAERVAESLKSLYPKVGFEIRFDDDARWIVSDEDKIRQVFTNLLNNAIKYSPENGTVRIIGKSRGKQSVVSVADEGPGIPRDQQDKIFETFYRVQGEINRNVSGTGLGLSIVSAILKALGGQISAGGEEGKGSVFTFIIPKEGKMPAGPKTGA